LRLNISFLLALRLDELTEFSHFSGFKLQSGGCAHEGQMTELISIKIQGAESH
jgi:hypothetical protein